MLLLLTGTGMLLMITGTSAMGATVTGMAAATAAGAGLRSS